MGIRVGRAAVLAVTLVLSVAACGGTTRTGSRTPSPGTLAPTTTATTSANRPPAGFVPATASFPTPEQGYAWGIAPCPHDRSLFCPGLAATANGGGSWYPLPAPVGLPTNAYRRALLRFSDISNGWAVLGGIQSTHDGAQTWQPVSLPGVADPQVADLETAAGLVYVVASNAAVAGSPLRLYVSHTNSDAFQVVPGVHMAAAGTGVSLSFDADGEGYVAATAVGGVTQLYRTSGNDQWAPVLSPCDAGMTATVAAGPEHQVTVICDGLASSNGALKVAWHSIDDGLNFVLVASPPSTGFTAGATQVPDAPLTATTTPTTSDSPPTTTTSSSTVGPAQPTTGLALVVIASARADRIYLTESAGRSWTVAFASSGDASGSGLGLADLAFSDSTHGYVILGDAGLYALDREAGRHLVPGPRLLTTQDGGKHWAQTVISED
jgi:photosystem II stability/assembly factor-like uncharacterized protein